MARLSMLRVLRGRPGRDQILPQQYSVVSSWKGMLKESAEARLLFTYSVPSTARRTVSPLLKSSLAISAISFCYRRGIREIWQARAARAAAQVDWDRPVYILGFTTTMSPRRGRRGFDNGLMNSGNAGGASENPACLAADRGGSGARYLHAAGRRLGAAEGGDLYRQ